MIKAVVKLALAAFVANATWRIGSAYVQFAKFEDATTQAAQYSADKNPADLRLRVLDLATQYDLPLNEEALSVQRDEQHHTLVDASYRMPIQLLPGYRYSWPFRMHVDVFSIPAAVPLSPRPQ